MNGNAIRRAHCLLPGTLMATLIVALAACSSSSSTAKHPAHLKTASAAPAASTSAASPQATAGALSGTWSGKYSGSYNGTFTLRWRQSGTRLSGTITISSPHSRLPIHGTVNGSAISFGTVGGAAITYSGTVSGSSMSGTYQVNGNGGGPWSASRA
jgi:hypothetical protein